MLSSSLSAIWNETAAVFTNAGYSFFKIEAHVVCAAVVVILLYRQQNSSDQTEARIVWSRLLSVQILYCIAGIIRVLVDVAIIPKNYATRYTAAAFTFGLFGAMCWLVFEYIEFYQHSEMMKSKGKRFMAALPFIFNTAMLAVAGFFPGLFADFSGRTYTRGILYPVMMLINFAYPVAAVILSVRRRSRMTRYERDTAPVMATYPAFFMICGPLQDLNWRIPFLCYVIVVSDIFVYMSYADSLVSVDPLTRIANKNALMRNLSERFKTGEPVTLHVFAVDVDSLGKINGTYGRTEGDKVLILVANALRKFSADEHTCDIFRYYGDEFIITADIETDEERELFTEHIRNYVSNAAMSAKLPFHVKISIGRAKYEPYSKTETISGLIDEAEKTLYEGREQRSFQQIWKSA
ncbi:MAG: GGDEF domain-containing protein [Synergistaceae bacterium]|nr:GGDEF domain-containing protein [Synergistaceae bacterium]